MKKLITLPDDLAERLGKGRHQSQVVVEALYLYYLHKDTVKRLIQLADSLEKRLNPEYTFKQSPQIPGLPERDDDEPPHGFVDPTNRLRRWNGYNKEWEPN